MTQYFINSRGQYYQGDRMAPQDLEVPERPSGLHIWDGTSWVYSEDLAATKTRERSLVELVDSDSGMVRALEDLIALLIAKGTITQEELPPIVRDKIAARQALRENL